MPGTDKKSNRTACTSSSSTSNSSSGSSAASWPYPPTLKYHGSRLGPRRDAISGPSGAVAHPDATENSPPPGHKPTASNEAEKHHVISSPAVPAGDCQQDKPANSTTSPKTLPVGQSRRRSESPKRGGVDNGSDSSLPTEDTLSSIDGPENMDDFLKTRARRYSRSVSPQKSPKKPRGGNDDDDDGKEPRN